MEKFTEKIDLRIIKCSCGGSSCERGISFDSESDTQFRLRFHFEGDEKHMLLDRYSTSMLIDELKDFKKLLKK